MKKYLVFIVTLCCLLSGCGVSGQPAQPTQVPQINEVSQGAVEAVPAEGPVVVKPLPATIEMAALGNCTVAVSIDEGNIYRDESGNIMIRFTVYNYDLYDMADIAALKPGDGITILGEDVLVTSIERNERGDVIINGGLDVGGYVLRADESGVFWETGYNDAKSYYPIGEAVFGTASGFVFTDGIDLDNPPVTYSAEELLENIGSIIRHFVPHNTKLVVENGAIIAMERVYMP